MDAKPFTMETLREAMEKIEALPPPPLFLSSRLFPSDKAITAKGKRDHVAGAHPSFWRRFEASQDRIRARSLDALGRIQVVEVDDEEGDTELQKKRKYELRCRFAEALCDAAGVDHDPYGFKSMSKFGMGPLKSNQL